MSDPASTPARPRTALNGRWAALLVLIAVPFVFYAAMVLGGKEPPAADTAAVRPFGIWGLEQQHATGQVPDWYPYVFSGMPSYGSYTYTPRSPFNPVALVQRLCGQNRGAYYWFLLSMAGLAGFAFLRRQGFSRTASTIAALLFSMTPYIPGVVEAGHSTKLEALCLLPVFFLALDLLLERPEPIRAAFVAGAVAMLGWANHPQIAFYGLMVGSFYAAAVLILEHRSAGRGYWLRLGGFGAAAILLVAGMVAEPFLAVREYAPWSIRGAGAAGEGGTGVGWDYATAWSFDPRELLSFFFPGWFGLQGSTYWGFMPFTSSTHYFGVAALATAIIGLVRSRRPRRWIWGGISIFILFVGFGRHLPLIYGPMYHVVPFFNKFRIPSMIYSLLPLCLAFPVAAGIDAMLTPAGSAATPVHGPSGGKRKGAASSRAPSPARRLLVAGAVVAVLWIILALGARGSLGNPGSFLRPEEARGAGSPQALALQADRLSILEKSVAHGMVVLLLGLGVLALRRSRAVAGWIGVLAGVVLVGDVVLVGRSFYAVEPRADARTSLPMPGACDFVKRQPGAFRIFPASSSMFTSNAFGLAGLESIGGYHTARLRAYQDLRDADLLSHPAVLAMLNVRYVLAPSRIESLGPPVYQGDGFVYAWPDSLPRAWSVRRVEPVADFDAFKRKIDESGFNPAETALVDRSDAPARADFTPAVVRLEAHGPGLDRLWVDAPAEAFVVLSEMAFPPGWRALVDGRPAPIHRVNHVLMGIEVPAGSHEVAFSIHAPGRLRGMRASRLAASLTLVLAAAAFGLDRLGRRRAGTAQEAGSPPAVK